MSIRLRDYLLLLFILALGYWMVLVYTLPYDMLDCWLPWRHFVSKGFHQGMIPLWNPYQQLGYPVYADLQGPLFSLENFVTGTWFNMNLTVLQSILFAYICTAAIGMYELGRYLFKHRQAALAIALAYSMGGFFSHHLQHFFTIVSVSLLPFTLLMVLKFLETPQWKYIFALALLFHLSFTTGNQTFNLINGHFLVVMFARKIVVHFKQKQKTAAWKLIRQTVFLWALVLAVILPVLVAFWQSKPYIARYEGLEYAKSLSNSMTLVAFQSFINPFISTQPVSYLGTDPSMAGYFFGLGALAFALTWFFFAPGRTKWLWLILLVFFALLSLGETSPLHYWLYKADPLLRLFRFPAYYMFYVYLLLLMAAGYGISQVFENKIQPRYFFLVATGLVLLVFTCMGIYGVDKGMALHHLRTGHWFDIPKGLNLANTYTFAALLAIITAVSALVYYRWQQKKILLLGMALEMVITCHFTLWQSFLPQPASQTDTFIASLPQNFSLPPNDLGTDEKLIPHLPVGTWRNYHGYFNVVSPEFFNSFYTHNIQSWEKDATINKTQLWKNRREHSLRLTTFEPNLVVFETPFGKKEQIQFNQQYFPYWKLYLNKRPVPLPPGVVMTINAPEGTQEIKLVFENPVMVFCFWFSLGAMVLVVVFLLGTTLPRIGFVFSTLVFVAVVSVSLWPFVSKKEPVTDENFGLQANGPTLINKAKTEAEFMPGVYDARFELNELLYELLSSTKKNLEYTDSGNFNPPVILDALEARYSRVIKKTGKEVTRYEAIGRISTTGPSLVFDLDTNLNTGWNIPEGQLVTDSLTNQKYCLLTEQWPFGPVININQVPVGQQAFFCLCAQQNPEVTTGKLMLVLEVTRDNQNLVYMAQPLEQTKARLVFAPAYRFTGHETIKLYYWLNGKGSARISSQELEVIPYK